VCSSVLIQICSGIASALAKAATKTAPREARSKAASLRPALQKIRTRRFLWNVLRQTKAPATVANADKVVIMEMDADLF